MYSVHSQHVALGLGFIQDFGLGGGGGGSGITPFFLNTPLSFEIVLWTIACGYSTIGALESVVLFKILELAFGCS